MISLAISIVLGRACLSSSARRYPTLLGVLCGALTSTPGLSSVCELIGTGSEEAVWSYGCSYLPGVIFAVFFAQLFSRNTSGNGSGQAQNTVVAGKIYPELMLIGIIKIDTFDTDWLLSHSVPNTSLRNVPLIGEGITAELVTDNLILQLNGDGISDFAATKVWYNSVSNVNTDISNGTAAVRENALNGESVMSFDGTSGLTVSGLDKLTGDITYFIVYKSNVASFVGSTDEPVIFRSTHANGLKTSVKPMYDSLCTQLTGGYFAVAEEFIDTNWHIVAVTWTGGDEQTALLSQFTDGNTTVKFEVGSLALKKSDAKGVQYIAQSFDGEIAEILVYNRCLDDSEVASTGMALAEKFGLTWTAYEPTEPGKDTENPDNTGSDTTESGTETAGESSADTAKNDKKGCGSSVGITAVGIVTSVCGTAVCKRRKRNK